MPTSANWSWMSTKSNKNKKHTSYIRRIFNFKKPKQGLVLAPSRPGDCCLSCQPGKCAGMDCRNAPQTAQECAAQVNFLKFRNFLVLFNQNHYEFNFQFFLLLFFNCNLGFGFDSSQSWIAKQLVNIVFFLKKMKLFKFFQKKLFCFSVECCNRCGQGAAPQTDKPNLIEGSASTMTLALFAVLAAIATLF